MTSRTRVAFVCAHKDCVPPQRLFLDDEPERPPVCPDGHGRMQRQANVKPGDRVGRGPRRVGAPRRPAPSRNGSKAE